MFSRWKLHNTTRCLPFLPIQIKAGNKKMMHRSRYFIYPGGYIKYPSISAVYKIVKSLTSPNAFCFACAFNLHSNVICVIPAGMWQVENAHVVEQHIFWNWSQHFAEIMKGLYVYQWSGCIWPPTRGHWSTRPGNKSYSGLHFAPWCQTELPHTF